MIVIEVRPRLQVCHVYVSHARVSNIVIEEGNMRVDLISSNTSGDHQSSSGDKSPNSSVRADSCLVDIPGLELKPNSVANFVHLDEHDGTYFRVQTDKCSIPTIGSSNSGSNIFDYNSRNTSYVPCVSPNEPVSLLCKCCSAPLVQRLKFRRILPLPSDSWDSSDWFCHKHSSQEREKDDVVDLSIQPKNEDLLYGSYNFLLNNDIRLSSVNEGKAIVECAQCAAWLGETNKRAYRTFWNSTVVFRSENEELDRVDRWTQDKDRVEEESVNSKCEQIDDEVNKGTLKAKDNSQQCLNNKTENDGVVENEYGGCDEELIRVDSGTRNQDTVGKKVLKNGRKQFDGEVKNRTLKTKEYCRISLSHKTENDRMVENKVANCNEDSKVNTKNANNVRGKDIVQQINEIDESSSDVVEDEITTNVLDETGTCSEKFATKCFDNVEDNIVLRKENKIVLNKDCKRVIESADGIKKGSNIIKNVHKKKDKTIKISTTNVKKNSRTRNNALKKNCKTTKESSNGVKKDSDTIDNVHEKKDDETIKESTNSVIENSEALEKDCKILKESANNVEEDSDTIDNVHKKKDDETIKESINSVIENSVALVKDCKILKKSANSVKEDSDTIDNVHKTQRDETIKESIKTVKNDSHSTITSGKTNLSTSSSLNSSCCSSTIKPSSSDTALSDFINVLKENIGINSKILFQCQASNETVHYLLLWIMDRSLNIYSWDKRVRSSSMSLVMKVLFMYTKETPDASWNKDFNLVHISISKQMLLAVLKHLNVQAQYIPKPYRHTQNMKVSYIQLAN